MNSRPAASHSPDVLPMLTVRAVEGMQGPLDFLTAALGQHITDPESLARAREAANVLRTVIALRRVLLQRQHKLVAVLPSL